LAASEVRRTERAGARFGAGRALRRSLIAAAVAAVVSAPVASWAQAPPQAPNAGVLTPSGGMSAAAIPDPNAALLQPSLQGNPAKPPRFRRPGDMAQDQAPATDKFTAPSRIGATPVYGSPAGFGAGDTGFDSSNTPKSKKKAVKAKAPPAPGPGVSVPESTFDPLSTTQFSAPAQPTTMQPLAAPAPAQPAASEVYPAKAAARPGAVLPPPTLPVPIGNVPPEVYPLVAAHRAGATVPVPLPLDADASVSTPPPGTQPISTLPLGTRALRLLPLGDGDAYSPLGIRGGSFMFFPAVELATAYSNNPQSIPHGGGSPYFVVAPELLVQSDWSRHALTASVIGSYTDYTNGSFVPSLNRPYLNSKIDGRIDVTRDTQIVLENRLLVSTDNPGSPNLPAGLAKLPVDTTLGGTLGIVQNFNRLIVSLKGTFDRVQYQNSVLTDGETASNADRDLNQYAGIARVGFDLDAGVKPFVEVQQDARVYDEQFDSGGQQRSSIGTSVKAGATVDLFGSLSGAMAVGYLDRTYQDPTLPKLSGVIADGALIWRATALTTATLTASSLVSESTIPGVSGELSRDVGVEVDQAFRRWLIGTLKLGHGQDNYVGEGRLDNRYFASVGMTYKLNRDIWLRTEVREDRLNSNFSGASYWATSVLAGVRLQR
jgi:hypothetical protein